MRESVEEERGTLPSSGTWLPGVLEERGSREGIHPMDSSLCSGKFCPGFETLGTKGISDALLTAEGRGKPFALRPELVERRYISRGSCHRAYPVSPLKTLDPPPGNSLAIAGGRTAYPRARLLLRARLPEGVAPARSEPFHIRGERETIK